MSAELIAHLTESLAVERRRVDLLLERLYGGDRSTAHGVEIPDPEVPPDVVMAAIKTISPTKDRTYEANYAYWDANKERAAAHPEAFAAEIIEGASLEL